MVPSATSRPKLSMKESNIWIVPESTIMKASNGRWKESEPSPTRQERVQAGSSIRCGNDSLGKGQVTARQLQSQYSQLQSQ